MGGLHPSEIDYLRTGRFSGSAISLRDALSKLTAVRDHDTIELKGGFSAIPARMLARAEALTSGGAHWSKTAAWSKHLQRRMAFLDEPARRPLVVVQTMSAVVPPAGAAYVVYTDRTAVEGSAQGYRNRPDYTTGWLRRERQLLRGARRVLVMGESSVAFLTRDYGIPIKRVNVVGAAPNWTLGGGVPARRVNAPGQVKTLLFVGTQWELKGGPTLLAAHKTLQARGHNVDLEIVGCSPPVQSDHVLVRGRVAPSEMPAIYSAADIFALPTRFEAFGVSYVEAITMGLPCIGSDISNIPATIGDAGLTAPTDNPEALADAVEQVLRDYDNYVQAAKRRAQVLAETHSWAAIAATCLDSLAAG